MLKLYIIKQKTDFFRYASSYFVMGLHHEHEVSL